MYAESHMYKTKVVAVHEIEDLELCEVTVGINQKW